MSDQQQVAAQPSQQQNEQPTSHESRIRRRRPTNRSDKQGKQPPKGELSVAGNKEEKSNDKDKQQPRRSIRPRTAR